jgi:hypothetical protein
MGVPVLFEEVQQFRQKWLEGLMLAVNTLLIAGYFATTFFSATANHEANTGLLAAIILCGLITFLLKRLKLITQVTTEGIQIRFSPLQTRFILFRWDDIEQLTIRTYNPVLEYGGWGIRFGPSGNAYNVSGNVGLQLVLRGNRKLLIGTTKAGELIELLQGMGRL